MVEGLLQRGCVVISSAGRDKGLYMAVVNKTAEGVWVADGRERLLQRPKRKNPRHIEETCFSLDESSMATNRELRRALAAYRKAQSQ